MTNIENMRAALASLQHELQCAKCALELPFGGLFRPRSQVEIAVAALARAELYAERLAAACDTPVEGLSAAEEAISRPQAPFSEACPGLGSGDIEKALLGRSAGSFADGP